MEVVVGALMVALIATASLGAFGDISKLTEGQRNEEQAATLAEQDQARLRGLTIAELSASGTGTGNWAQPATTLNGTSYHVTSSSQFISGANGNAACSGGTADEVQTTSEVTWGTNNGGQAPVIIHGLITPFVGGAVVANIDTMAGQVTGASGAGAVGATISLSGPTTSAPVTVDASGCAVFTGLASGSYTVSFTQPPTGTWNVYPSGASASSIPSQSLTVTTGETTPATTVLLEQFGAVQASFQTTYVNQSTLQAVTTPSESDTFVLANPQLTTQVIGTDSSRTNNAYAATVTSPTTIVPFASGMPSNYLYTAYAGGCTADAPTGTYAPQGFAVAPATTTDVTLPEPAMLIYPYGPGTPGPTSFTYDDNPTTSPQMSYSGTGWTHSTTATGAYDTSESDANATSNSVTVTLPLGTTQVKYIATKKSSYGKATIALTGQSNTTADLYNSTTQYQQTVYTSPTLTATTQYTLTISWSGTKNSSSSGTTIDVDEITGTIAASYSQGALLTTAPDVTLTDTGTGCSNNEDYPPTQVPTQAQGALVYPGVPDTNYSVCVDNGTNHYTQNVSAATLQTNFNTGTVVNADIYAGAPAPPGGGAGYGTGTCP